VDLDDYDKLAACLSGPRQAAGYALPPAQCRTVFDFDGDGDVDLLDYGVFQEVFGG
jgi:hypothetical protein